MVVQGGGGRGLLLLLGGVRHGSDVLARQARITDDDAGRYLRCRQSLSVLEVLLVPETRRKLRRVWSRRLWRTG